MKMLESLAVVYDWLVGRLYEENLQVVFRRMNAQQYEDAFECVEYRMVDYDPLMLDYQIAYMQSAGWVAEDLSIVLLHNGRAAGICPLIILQRGQETLLSSSVTDVFPPLFATGVEDSVRKRLTKGWLSSIRHLAVRWCIPVWHGQEGFRNQEGLSHWHHLLMMSHARLAITHDWYVDLSRDLAVIKAGFRTSYKSLINKADRLWRVRVIRDFGDREAWDEFHALHASVAGKETRAQATWELQWDAIVRGRGFLICLSDATGRMVGGGYFHFTTDEAIYAVGAYDRDLFDKPLGHAVQHHAIRELKSKGVRWYRIGRQCYENDVPAPTDKECAISNFKSGFATHLFPVYRTFNHA
ncbi:FemAB family protein [Castellaniella ginsengisoli]|uniref:FemAB family protein n=1 Tax=Castellaniella ginsengisoli TaxID=546114 RepID=A0AB39D4Z2_9BURK